ncbi:MAG: hypothetical protein MUF50_02425 [Planctomycetes bacterium]|jgi:hypothetical protein|nr:hypothetical protein [Planctomycetota bacterium]
MEKIFYLILVILATWWITSSFFKKYVCSPRARVEKLWKEIFSIAQIMDKEKNNSAKSFLYISYQYGINEKYKMINALLDYYFNPKNEDDRSYIQENKPPKSEGDLKKEHNTSCIVLREHAQNWLKLYDNNKNNKNTETFYCLFLTLELYLKSLLCFYDAKYNNINELKKINHSFKNLLDCLEKLNIEKLLLSKIKLVIKKYNLLNIDVNAFRYSEVNTAFKLNFDSLYLQELFDLFNLIDEKIKTFKS